MNFKVEFLLVLLFTTIFGSPQLNSKCRSSELFLHTNPTTHSDYSEVPPAATRLPGGRPLEENHPHMVALTLGFGMRVLIGAGSLVSYRAVLTAAHCVCPAIDGDDDIQISSNLYGVMGTNKWKSFGQLYTFSRIFVHPYYDVKTVRNDIALLITATDVLPSLKVNPITMNFDAVAAGVVVTAAGWGRTDLSNSVSSTLRKFTMYVIDYTTCSHEAIKAATMTGIKWLQLSLRSSMCTLHQAGYSICQGDSGSALIKQSTGGQVGIVSWGFPCAVNGPDLHLRLSEYRQWIVEHMV